MKNGHFVISYLAPIRIGLTPLIALIYISVEPAVTQNCVASVTNKQTNRIGPDH